MVPCPGCGRQYDVSLFQFGRTIHCTCGRRVALAPRVISAASAPELRFSVDAMLGRLARWLRLIGYDAAFEAEIEDAELARRALEEGRVVLTRDRALPVEWSLPRVLIVESESLPEQLRQVVDAFDLDWKDRLFTRCSRCNAPLDRVERAALPPDVPPRVLERQRHFQRCPRCERIYWGGSHSERIRHALASALGAKAG